MKGLFHSKVFKRNLKRWLFMYVVAILLLTTVVTYSKYVSNIVASGNAHIPKFNVIINQLTTTSNQYSQIDTIPYEFKVDTSQLEVDTLLVLSIYVDPDFRILSVKDGDNQENTIYTNNSTFETSNCPNKPGNVYCYETKNKYDYDITWNKDANIITIQRKVAAIENDSTTYTIEVKYKNELGYLTTGMASDIVKIGYSATQVKEGNLNYENN